MYGDLLLILRCLQQFLFISYIFRLRRSGHLKMKTTVCVTSRTGWNFIVLFFQTTSA